MKWYKFSLRMLDRDVLKVENGFMLALTESDARARKISLLREAGWLSNQLTEFTLNIELDEKLTKDYDDNNKWGGNS